MLICIDNQINNLLVFCVFVAILSETFESYALPMWVIILTLFISEKVPCCLPVVYDFECKIFFLYLKSKMMLS